MKRKITIGFADSYEELSPDEIATLLEQQDAIEKLFAGAKAFAAAQITAGKKIPGWTMEPGKNSRVWKDEKKAAELLAKQGVNDPYNRTVEFLSVAQAEKKVADPKALKDGWENVPGKPTLKRATGAAALAASSSAKPDFTF